MALTTEQLKELGQKLHEIKKQLLDSLEEAKKNLDYGDDVDSFDEETDEAEEYANFLSIKQVIDGRIRRIEQMLNKISDGSYGKCEECGGEIPYSFLKENPDSLLCVECKKKLQ